jgi:hypothetical protein
MKINLFDQDVQPLKRGQTKKRTNSRPAVGLITRHDIELIKLQLCSVSLCIEF